jgi:oligopeptide/dipeptide ABC transporter ATP-binding protein
VCRPALLIADEPTTALDVTIQAQILQLIQELQKEFHMAVLLITHDLGVVAEMANHVAVMYAGKIVEQGPVEEIFEHPRHPYTIGLFGSLPRIDEKKARLEAIEGSVPAATRFPEGCRFRERCKWAVEKCREEPPLIPLGGTTHLAACWRAEEIANGAPQTKS